MKKSIKPLFSLKSKSFQSFDQPELESLFELLLLTIVDLLEILVFYKKIIDIINFIKNINLILSLKYLYIFN